MIRAKNAFAAPLIAVVLLLVLAAAAQASTIVVNDTGDPAGAGDCPNSGQCSLRQAVAAASSGDTIQLDDSTYSLTQGSNIEINKNLTIAGDGVNATVIDGSGNGQVRILRVDAGTVLIQGLSMTHGVDGNDEAFQSCSPCETINANGGGSLFNDGGNVTSNDVAFNGNGEHNPLGGAISNRFGNLTLTDVSFTDSRRPAEAHCSSRGGNVNGVGVTFENNGGSAFDGGAAYVLRGNLSLTNATIVGNGWASSIGGGIANGGGTLTLVHDTFSGNIRGAIQTDQGAETIVGSTIIGAGFADGTDFACLPSGRWTDELNDVPVGQAITNDDGNNLDEDGHCGFNGNGTSPTKMRAWPRSPTTAARPARRRCSPAARRSATPTSSNARQPISATSRATAPATSARSIPNPRPRQRVPTTSEAGNITDSSADLHGTINLSGDAGGFHFVWGLSQDDLLNSTSVQGAGVVSSDTFETQTLGGLNPGTQYFYKIVADNSTGSTPDTASNIQSFTTQADPPSVFNVNKDSVTDTTANLSFTINPNGADTSYVIQYGDGDPGNDLTTDPIHIGAAAGDQQLTATLQNLDPNSTYHFEVIATNSVDTTTQSGQDFATDQQIAGIQRLPIELDDSGTSNFGCPQTARIDWGDNSGVQQVVPDCLFPGDEEDPAQYSLTADHTYAQSGHYEIQITYTDIEQTSTQFAQIAENDVQPPSNNTLPAISGTTTSGHTLTTTDGNWSGDPAFDYQWQDCDQNGDNCTDTGDDQNTYALTNSDVGSTIRVIVTASNDGGSTPATSDPTAVVAGPAPSNNAPAGDLGNPEPGQLADVLRRRLEQQPDRLRVLMEAGRQPNLRSDCSDVRGAVGRPGPHVDLHGDRAQRRRVLEPGHKCGGRHTLRLNWRLRFQADVGQGVEFGDTSDQHGVRRVRQPRWPRDDRALRVRAGLQVHRSRHVWTRLRQLDTVAERRLGLEQPDRVRLRVGARAERALPRAARRDQQRGHDVRPRRDLHDPAGARARSADGHQVVRCQADPGRGADPGQRQARAGHPAQADPRRRGDRCSARHAEPRHFDSAQGHKTQTGTFGGAIFKVTQDHSGLTTLTLVENAFKGAPSYASCKVAHGKASAAALSAKTLQLLKGRDNHGKFRTKGRYAAATTRGTAWSVADRCDGTLTKVTQSSVLVNDFVRHVSLILHAGHSYLALAKPPRHK